MSPVKGAKRELNTIEIEIFGHKLTITSDSEEEYVHKIADYLNKKIDEVLQTTKTVDTLNMVILTALNIVEELFHTKNKEKHLRKLIEDRSKYLISFIDSNVESGYRTTLG